MKRSNGDESDDTDHNSDKAEMSVDEEGKMEVVVAEKAADNDDDEEAAPASSDEDSGEDEDEDDHIKNNNRGGAAVAVPFLDTFYGLSSSDSRERSRAAQDMILYCLIDPATRNAKDAAYALKRLMKGLCSGRAAARQGCASALASFLKIAHRNQSLADIQQEEKEGSNNKEREDLSCFAFVRQRLLVLTSPSDGGSANNHGRRKGSEDRDCKFGLLFGVLSIVRSGILLPMSTTTNADEEANNNNSNDIVAVSCALAKDLSDLYHYKKWLREPAAHAIGTLLNSFYNAAALCKEKDSDHDASVMVRKIVSAIVEEVVIPEILHKGDERVVTSSGQEVEQQQASLYDTYSAEQVAVFLNIQANSIANSIPLPKPFDRPLLTKASISKMSQSLSDTSRVVQPRTHLVWDAFFFFVSESSPVSSALEEEADNKESGVDVRRLRKQCYGKESSVDLVSAVMKHVVLEQLLKVVDNQRDNSATTSTNKSTKMTHERGALALCLVRNLSGVEFHSSITGRTRLILDPDVIENHVFCPNVIRPLFTSILGCRGGGGGGGSITSQAQSTASPLLRPLSLQILESIVDSLDNDNSKADRRLAFARPLLRCDPRFDSKTKTSVIAHLVQAGVSFEYNKDPSLFEELTAFLVTQIAAASDNEDEAKTAGRSSAESLVTSYEAQGYIDLLFNLAKTVLGNQQQATSRKGATETPDKGVIQTTNKSIPPEIMGVIQRVQGVFMCAAFFDCKDVQQPKSSSSTRKKSSPSGSISGTGRAAINTASVFKAVRASDKSMTPLLPLHVRTAASARFFSLVASTVSVSMRSSHNNKDHQTATTDLLLDLQRAWDALEQAGARLIDRGPQEDEDPKKTLLRLQQKYEKLCGSNSKTADELKKCIQGFFVLSQTLYIALLDCGGERNKEDSGEDPADVMEHSGVAMELFSDLKDTVELFFGKPESGECPLSRLSVVCSNILSSPIAVSTQSHGAYPTLLREVVKNAWVCALNLSDTAPDNYCRDPNFVDNLLKSIGASTEGFGAEDMDESDEDSDSDSDEEELNNSNDVSHSDDQRDGKDAVEGMEEDDRSDNMEFDGEDELDPERLQALLEEDSDASVNSFELEHHAGADAALAKLIQAKQDVRKAGRAARERTITAGQLRCIMLLEALLVGRSKGRGTLLSIDKCLQMIVSVVSYRKQIERSLADNKGSESASSSEKRDLLERLTSLLKTRLFRWKFSSSRWGDSVSSIKDFCSSICLRLLIELKGRISKEQRTCCSLAMVSVLRAVSDAATKLELAHVYEEAISEWSSKRTTRLESSMFDDLIDHDPLVAQASLPLPLSRAVVSEARSPYLKSECFRLLSKLYNAKLNKQKSSELEKLAHNRIRLATEPVIKAFSVCLNDPEMRKAKRSREVLKGLEKIVDFSLSSGESSSSSSDVSSTASTKRQLSGLCEQIINLKQTSDSPAVKSSCDRLLVKLASVDGEAKNNSGSQQQQQNPPTGGVVEAEGDADDIVDESGTPSSKRKRKSKKKKKGKK